MPIIQLKPAFKDYIWGGNKIKKMFGKDFPGDILAESWELSAHPDGSSVVSNGEFAGFSFPDYLIKAGKGVLGKNCDRFDDFPILIKFIDAKKNLSIQVHPDDEYALKHEHQNGKTECWFIADAEDGAGIYYGLKEQLTKEEFSKRIEDGSLIDCLRFIPVKKGELYFIPSGTLHSIASGTLIVEIQQNSNVTYRVYDYGRTGTDGLPRPLHIRQALDVTDLSGKMPAFDFGSHLADCKYFTVDALRPDENPFITAGEDSFCSLLVIEGSGLIQSDQEELSFRAGDSLFLPAGSGSYQISGAGFILKTTIGSDR